MLYKIPAVTTLVERRRTFVSLPLAIIVARAVIVARFLRSTHRWDSLHPAEGIGQKPRADRTVFQKAGTIFRLVRRKSVRFSRSIAHRVS